jgi:hypothetical protein
MLLFLLQAVLVSSLKYACDASEQTTSKSGIHRMGNYRWLA